MVINDLKKYLRKCLPNNIITQFSYSGKKLSSMFRVKDKISKEHQSDLIYYYDSGLNMKCNKRSDYIGETNVRYGKRTSEHELDTKSSIKQHCIECNHDVTQSEFKILASGYNNTRKRKLAEALYIRDIKPSLNKQKDSYKLHLFN